MRDADHLFDLDHGAVGDSVGPNVCAERDDDLGLAAIAIRKGDPVLGLEPANLAVLELLDRGDLDDGTSDQNTVVCGILKARANVVGKSD